ncbi:MAG: hypothetical protein QG608_2874 [Actinomycetota bacterium]|nr:hypothetical protein [Actinomycetota bacterium]
MLFVCGAELRLNMPLPSEREVTMPQDTTVLDSLTADLFDLDTRTVPVTDIVGSNTTSDCTDDGCSSTCTSRGCSATCRC